MATNDEIYEKAIGNINDINTLFSTSNPYQSNTLRMFLNGIIIDPDDDDGFIELDPSSGIFQTKIPPKGSLDPDILHVRYLEA